MLYVFSRVLWPGVIFDLLFYGIIKLLDSTISAWSVICPINRLHWHFLVHKNLEIISCEPFLHQCTEIKLIIYFLVCYMNFLLCRFWNNGFNSMLMIRLFFCYVFCRGLQDLHIFFPGIVFQNHHLCYLTLYIDRCLLLTSLLDGVILTWIWNHVGYIKLLMTHHLFQPIPGEK